MEEELYGNERPEQVDPGEFFQVSQVFCFGNTKLFAAR